MKQAQVTSKNRKGRQNRKAFNSLINSPAVGAITLPAGARLALKSVSGATAGTTAATITGVSNRTIKTPLLVAGGSVKLDYVEPRAVVTPASGFEVLLDVGLGRFVKIGGA